MRSVAFQIYAYTVCFHFEAVHCIVHGFPPRVFKLVVSSKWQQLLINVILFPCGLCDKGANTIQGWLITKWAFKCMYVCGHGDCFYKGTIDLIITLSKVTIFTYT